MKETKPDQHFAIVLCKIMKVLSIIGKVGIVIGIVCLGVCLVATPIIGSQIEIDEGQAKIFKQEINYTATEDNTIIVSFNDSEDGIAITESDFEIFNFNASKIVEYIDSIPVKRIIIVIMVVLLTGVIELVVMLLIINLLIEVLTNTIKEETPFIASTPGKLVAISKYILLGFIISCVASLIIALLTVSSADIDVISISFDLSKAMIVYIMAWVVEKGNNKRTPKTTKI